MNYFVDTLVAGSAESFNCKKEAQKYLIEFILNCSCYDLEALAEVLDVNVLLLSDALSGKGYLKSDTAKNLVDWFLLLIRLD